jgi:hypothetical protein
MSDKIQKEDQTKNKPSKELSEEELKKAVGGKLTTPSPSAPIGPDIPK